MRRAAALASLAAAILVPGRALPAGTIESFWNAPGGGPFHDPAYWTGPVPDETVTAIFELDSSYYVTLLGGDAISDRLILRAGQVNLWIASFDGDDPHTYDSLNPLFLAPSVVVGENELDDAQVTIIAGVLNSRHTVIGLAPGSAGTVMFWAPGDAAPALVSQEHMHVGYQGQGTVVIDDRGTAACTDAVLGSTATGSGHVSVAVHGAALDCSGRLTVGKAGQGILDIVGGGDVVCGSSVIGQQAGSSGQVTIAGTGSTWTISTSLDVGMEGVGSMTIAGGGAVNNQGFTTIGTLPPFPGGGPGGSGEVTVSGPASVWLNEGDLFVGLLWTATLRVLDGAALTSRNASIGTGTYYLPPPVALAEIRGPGSVWSIAESLENYSTLSVADGGLVIAPTIDIEEGAQLAGDGTLVGDVLDSGTVRPGDPVGTLTVVGDIVQGLSAELLVELAGPAPGSFDSLVASGVVLLAGDLVVSLAPGFTPQRGDGFDVVVAGYLGGAFSALDLPRLAAPLTWHVEQNGQTLRLLVVNTDDLDGDGSVAVTDLLLLLLAWGTCPPGACPVDLDGDGSVGPVDLLILLANWS